MPEFVKRLRAVRRQHAALALEFLILTATRTGETLGAQWDEIDLDTATWTIPKERMKKTDEEFSVPLSERALDILRTLAAPPARTRAKLRVRRRTEAPVVEHGPGDAVATHER